VRHITNIGRRQNETVEHTSYVNIFLERISSSTSPTSFILSVGLSDVQTLEIFRRWRISGSIRQKLSIPTQEITLVFTAVHHTHFLSVCLVQWCVVKYRYIPSYSSNPQVI
jgi:hypothetical protein